MLNTASKQHICLALMLMMGAAAAEVANRDTQEAVYSENPAMIGETLCVSATELSCFGTGEAAPAWSTQTAVGYDWPAIVGNRVLAGSSIGVHVFDRVSGKPMWFAATQSRAFTPTVHRRSAFVSTLNGLLLALDLANGQQRWTRQFEGWIYAPALVNDTLITGGQDGTLIGLDPAHGRLRWQIELPQELVYRPVPGICGDVIVTTFSGHILSIDALDGRVRWQERDELASFSPVLSQGRLILLGLYRKLRARDAVSGRVLWQGTTLVGSRSIRAQESRVLAAGESVRLHPRRSLVAQMIRSMRHRFSSHWKGQILPVQTSFSRVLIPALTRMVPSYKSFIAKLPSMANRVESSSSAIMVWRALRRVVLRPTRARI